jgi:hypothetical protein
VHRRTPATSLTAPTAPRPTVRRRLSGVAAVMGLIGSLVLAATPAQGQTATAVATTTTSTRLTWRPPTLTSPTTVYVSSSKRSLSLDPARDYIIKMPSTPLEVRGGLVIAGGRNVVLIRGEIRISTSSTSGNDRRGLYLKNQTGTVHIEGLKITGSTLNEGINLDQRRGATVQLQNIRVDTVRGSYSGHHADVLQTWGGPAVLRIDRFTGRTTYQGVFLDPTKYDSPQPRLFDFRNMNIVGQSGSKYLFWRDSLGWPAKTTNVWAAPSVAGTSRSQFLQGNWQYVKTGVPSGGDFVPSGRAGLGYVSPGYL